MQATLADAGRFVNQDPIGLIGGANLYEFAPNTNKWLDVLSLNKNLLTSYWPPNRGALGEVRSITLPVGTLVDRYGYPGGTFVSPLGPHILYEPYLLVLIKNLIPYIRY